MRVAGKNIVEVQSMPLTALADWLNHVNRQLTEEAKGVVQKVLDDLLLRIGRILDVGAGYLCLNQQSVTLSAGETQRIKLASILGSNLTGVLYVLDEPSAGLHGRDTEKVINALRQLRDMGNTVIVIEHDLDIIMAADHIVDFGPGAGRNGGRIVAAGTVSEIIQSPESVTGKYLSKCFKK